MSARPTLRIVAATLAALAVLVAARDGMAYKIRGFVLGTGSARCSDASHLMEGTAGQSAIGLSGGSMFMLCSGYWCFGGAHVVVGVQPGADLPREFRLGRPTPTPSRDGVVRFDLELPRQARVELAVFDVAGRQIGEPQSSLLDAGAYRLSWQAPRGRAGVYFGRLRVDGVERGRLRMVLAQ